MEPVTILRPELVTQFSAALERGRVIFFTAPCGFGKTTVARTLLAGRNVFAVNAGAPGFALPGPEDSWEVLLVDDLPELSEEKQRALCSLIREYPKRRFVLLSRGAVPGWLLPFQLSGLVSVFDTRALAFDRQAAGQLLERYGVSVPDLELTAIQNETKGYPLALAVLARRMVEGAPYDPATTDQVRRELFLYLEETVYNRLDLGLQRLLLELAPFDTFGVELARIVSGDPHVGELLDRLQRDTAILLPDRLDEFHFWPLFRQFLRWEMGQRYSLDQQKDIYNRGGLYYELQEDYGRALACYAQAEDHSKVSGLLVKNAQLHPGFGHYEEMGPYYRALPREEILNSPALMQGMSMLCAISMDYEGSEQWYHELQNFAAQRKRGDAARRDARGRLAWLDIALPQRAVNGLTETIPAVFQLLFNREIDLPPFSITSAMPSIMNGGKDFSSWSKKDDALYTTLRKPVEAVLGKDGVGLADAAIAESKFEKGEDIMPRRLSLLARLEDVRRKGTPDMEFAIVGLLARSQVAAGRAEDARETLESLREQFVERGQARFLPNLDAMMCRIDLRLGNMAEADRWYRESAPRDKLRLWVMKRYQYLTQAMAELALGDPGAALLTLAPLGPYVEGCARHIDGMHLRIISAIAKKRLGDKSWRADFSGALDTAQAFQFVRPVAGYGSAVLPLLAECGWKGDFLKTLTDAAREQSVYYPDFLRPYQELEAPLSAAERQVLRLICADKSNGEIGAILDIQLSTVKTHVSRILKKLGVKRRNEAKTAAEKLRLL